jgi:hypothetical protein
MPISKLRRGYNTTLQWVINTARPSPMRLTRRRLYPPRNMRSDVRTRDCCSVRGELGDFGQHFTREGLCSVVRVPLCIGCITSQHECRLVRAAVYSKACSRHLIPDVAAVAMDIQPTAPGPNRREIVPSRVKVSRGHPDPALTHSVRTLGVTADRDSEHRVMG